MRAVIFDFDGTVADSFSTVMAIAYHLTHRQQLADLEHVRQMRENGISLTEAIKRLEIPKWQWPWLLQRGRRLMSRQMHQVPLFPGIEGLLRDLSHDKYQLYIISTNSTANVRRFLQDKGILPYFDKIYGGAGLFDKSKLIQRLLRQERLGADESLYVGDEVRDIMAAEQVGIKMIAVTWGYNSEELLSKYSSDALVSSVDQLGKVIDSWSKSD